MDKENNINWVEAFNDEAFVGKLKEYFEKFLDEHELSDEEFDDALNEIFKYDELNESITFNKDAFKKMSLRQTVENNNSNTQQTGEEIDNELLTNEEIEKATQNLRMHLLLSLMKDNGLELDKNNMSGDKSRSKKNKNHGNGARAATVMSVITGIRPQTCKNFIVNQTISTKNINDLVIKINSLLIDMGMRIRIRID